MESESPDEMISGIFAHFGIHSEWLVEHTKKTLIWLPERLSISYYSFTNITDQSWRGDYSPMLGWSVIADNLDYRFRSLTGQASAEERPLIRSIAQMNYYKLLPLKYTNNRSGASPGSLASFTYLLPQPLDIAGGVAYLLLLAAILSRASPGAIATYSIVGYALLFAMSRSLFLNPADYLLLLNGAFIFFVIFVVLVEARFASLAQESSTAAKH